MRLYNVWGNSSLKIWDSASSHHPCETYEYEKLSYIELVARRSCQWIQWIPKCGHLYEKIDWRAPGFKCSSRTWEKKLPCSVLSRWNTYYAYYFFCGNKLRILEQKLANHRPWAKSGLLLIFLANELRINFMFFNGWKKSRIFCDM